MEKRNSRSHFKIELGVLKPKKSYETEKEALSIARFLNTKENIIHKTSSFNDRRKTNQNKKRRKYIY